MYMYKYVHAFIGGALLCLSSTALATVTLKKSAAGNAYVGGTLQYTITTTRVGLETNLVLHDPLPAGHTLLQVQAGASSLDCTTTPSGALGPEYFSVSCNVAGELQAHVVDSASNPMPLVLTYRAPATAGTSSNTVTATCSGGCTPAPSASASAMVLAPTMTIAKSGPATVHPGGAIAWSLSAANTGPLPLADWSVDDALPAGAALVDVVIGGATFTAADLALSRTAPDGAQVTLSGVTLHIKGPALASQASYAFTIDAKADANAKAGTTLVNSAKATPAGGMAASSPSVTTTIQMTATSLALSKRVTPLMAKIGETVTYTLTVTPSAPTAGPLTLSDPLDPALKLNSVKINGQAVVCGSTPQPAGDFTLTCGSDGRTPTLSLDSGAMLAAPVGVDIAATVLPAAGAQIANRATLTDASGNQQTAAAPLTITNATTTGASLTLTAARLTAAKDDLVPFVANIGVPAAAMALAGPTLVITPSKGLRLFDVRVTGASGMTVPVKPTQMGAALSIPLAAITPGGAVAVQLRTRLNARAAVASQETMSAQLLQGTAALATAQATVRVLAEPDFDLGTILGDVFRDDNGNGIRDRGEPGVANAMVVMDDGLQALSDGAGHYHLAAILPGDRAVKLAEHTLPPGSKLTTDVTRIVPVTPGALIKIDFGVRVPAPEAPLFRPLVSTALPELRLSDAGRLIYRLTGAAAPVKR
jgi:fimbrial isopeptide formation D2 family protein